MVAYLALMGRLITRLTISRPVIPILFPFIFPFISSIMELSEVGCDSPQQGGPSLGLDQRNDARFGDEHVLTVHLQHHNPFLIQSDQSPPLGLRLPSSVGVHHHVGSAKHEHPSLNPAHRAT